MVNNFIRPSSFSAGHPLHGVRPITGYTARQQLESMFPSLELEEEGNNGHRGDADEAVPGRENIGSDEPLPELFQLAINVSFREMMRFFLIPEHDKVLSIRSRLRRENGVDSITIVSPQRMSREEFNLVREHLYEVQMQLIHTSRGVHCHLIL